MQRLLTSLSRVTMTGAQAVTTSLVMLIMMMIGKRITIKMIKMMGEDGVDGADQHI